MDLGGRAAATKFRLERKLELFDTFGLRSGDIGPLKNGGGWFPVMNASWHCGVTGALIYGGLLVLDTSQSSQLKSQDHDSPSCFGDLSVALSQECC